MVELILLSLVVALVASGLIFVSWRKKLIDELHEEYVLFRIVIPKKDSKEEREKDNQAISSQGGYKDYVAVMSQFYDSLYSIYNGDFENKLRGEDHISFEYALVEGQVNLYVSCPQRLAKLIEKKIAGFFQDTYLEEVGDYVDFNKSEVVLVEQLELDKESIFPVKNYKYISSDPLNDMVGSLSKLEQNESAAIQMIIRPVKSNWQEAGRKKAQEMLNDEDKKSKSDWVKPWKWPIILAKLMLKGEEAFSEDKSDVPSGPKRKTQIAEDEIKAIDEKNTKVGFDSLIRVVVSGDDEVSVQQNMMNLMSSFSLYAYTDGNKFSTLDIKNPEKIKSDYLKRAFSRPFRFKDKPSILTADELASVFHIPNIRFNRSPVINWQNYKIAPPPINIPKDGVLLGHNIYRGQRTEIRMKNEDRFRHFYVIGQTGTGKSSIFKSMIRQDIRAGHGVCVVDPHGDLVEDTLQFIPKERADDVIYFNPADLERPLGLNLLEAKSDSEKDLVALDAMNIMIKLFNEEVFGPRIQDYFRNGCLTLMEDPEGGALTDIVRLFTDDAFQKMKVEKVQNPIVKSFWENQMANTGAREKQEMIPYFAAKFGAFITNTMMRNIIGQTKSAFDFGEVMQDGKILLMNLSKGLTGDINSKLLGMIIVSKLQMAAMRRQTMAQEDRTDFYLYIDEFQNYVTDAIESILSEARKYRLSLNIAHQYIGQLVEKQDDKIKNAVFGNVGTKMCYKIGAQDAEYMAKEMAPVFSDQDLVNIDKFKSVMKLSIDNQPSVPFSVVPLNAYLETGDQELGRAIKELSRLKNGRDVEFVNREILRRIGV